MREALDVVDAMIRETVTAANRMREVDPIAYESLNASTGIGIRLQVLKHVKDRLLSSGMNALANKEKVR